MADDLYDQLRPATHEEWPNWLSTMVGAFGDTPSGPYVDSPPPTAELDRSLGLWDGGRLVATSGIYSRTLSVPGAVVPCAGVTWVTVAPTHRRRGVLSAMMRRQLTELHEQEREPVAALWASEAPIYGRFGYGLATTRVELTGPTHRLRVRPDVDLGTGRVDIVDESAFRPAAAAVHEAVRRFVPGNMARDERWWDRLLRDDPSERHGATARRYLLHTEADGTVSGYAAYRIKGRWSETDQPDSTLVVEDVRATSTPAYASLWKVLLSIDLVSTVRLKRASPDDPVRHLITDARALTGPALDALWVRLVDVGRALSARRYPARIDLVLDVRDPFCDWNNGRWHVWGHPSGAFCDRTDRDPDIALGIEDLAAAYLGGTSLATLQAAGRVTEISPGAVTNASTAFGWPVTPWCPDVCSEASMTSGWDDARRAFADAAEWFVGTVGRVGDRWGEPGLGEWDVRALVGHTSRSLLTVEAYLARPATTVEIGSAAEYFRATSAMAAGAAVAERGREAGAALGDDPAAAVADIAGRVLPLIGSKDGTELVTTMAGGMRLAEYLPTRTFELAVHTADLATALGIPPDLPATAAVESLRLVADLAVGGGRAGPLLLAATGRPGLPQGFSVLQP